MRNETRKTFLTARCIVYVIFPGSSQIKILKLEQKKQSDQHKASFFLSELVWGKILYYINLNPILITMPF